MSEAGDRSERDLRQPGAAGACRRGKRLRPRVSDGSLPDDSGSSTTPSASRSTPSRSGSRFEEALNIILPMLNGERPTLHGKHYHVTEAINSPAPISKIPVMIGGSGEQKTLRMVAQYATSRI